MPGAPTFLPTKSLGSLIKTPGRATAAMVLLDFRIHDGGASDRHKVEPAINSLEEKPAKSDRRSGSSPDAIAGGMLVLMPIRVMSASRPCLAKMPWSRATMAEAQSLVAVQAILSLNGSASEGVATTARAAAAAKARVCDGP